MQILLVIILVLVGVALFVVELFLIPGIGAAGVAGILSAAGGVAYAYLKLGAVAGHIALASALVLCALAIIIFLLLLTALFLLSTLVLLQAALAKGVLVVAPVLVLQILDHLLKLTNLGCQLYHKLFVTLVAGRHRVQGLLQGVYYVKQALDGSLEVINLVYVILALHIRCLFSH